MSAVGTVWRKPKYLDSKYLRLAIKHGGRSVVDWVVWLPLGKEICTNNISYFERESTYFALGETLQSGKSDLPVHALLSIAPTLGELLTNVFVFLMSTVTRKYSAGFKEGLRKARNEEPGLLPSSNAICLPTPAGTQLPTKPPLFPKTTHSE
ncbi:hypothetical protein TNIN_393861 [Trichonephila inaurata madagascariensis]|uniref:Uncharacterized protein n=1 Tax=Trichonephila inaurata madagascariensis TaxID=2747483 RepID=A0A8X6Y4S0_9ARAC|nr:hypothetical protein TNIN_393861 [Trichonephila inaurata madagascariensis]